VAKLKISAIQDDKLVKVTVELPAALHRDLIAYAEIFGKKSNQSATDPAKLIVPMLLHFVATDRGFVQARRSIKSRRAVADVAPPEAQ
jgi:hypothetical protein